MSAKKRDGHPTRRIAVKGERVALPDLGVVPSQTKGLDPSVAKSLIELARSHQRECGQGFADLLTQEKITLVDLVYVLSGLVASEPDADDLLRRLKGSVLEPLQRLYEALEQVCQDRAALQSEVSNLAHAAHVAASPESNFGKIAAALREQARELYEHGMNIVETHAATRRILEEANGLADEAANKMLPSIDSAEEILKRNVRLTNKDLEAGLFATQEEAIKRAEHIDTLLTSWKSGCQRYQTARQRYEELRTTFYANQDDLSDWHAEWEQQATLLRQWSALFEKAEIERPYAIAEANPEELFALVNQGGLQEIQAAGPKEFPHLSPSNAEALALRVYKQLIELECPAKTGETMSGTAPGENQEGGSKSLAVKPLHLVVCTYALTRIERTPEDVYHLLHDHGIAYRVSRDTFVKAAVKAAQRMLLERVYRRGVPYWRVTDQGLMTVEGLKWLKHLPEEFPQQVREALGG